VCSNGTFEKGLVWASREKGYSAKSYKNIAGPDRIKRGKIVITVALKVRWSLGERGKTRRSRVKLKKEREQSSGNRFVQTLYLRKGRMMC